MRFIFNLEYNYKAIVKAVAPKQETVHNLPNLWDKASICYAEAQALDVKVSQYSDV